MRMKTKTSLKIAVVDDQTLFRSGLISLFSEYDYLQVVFQACNGLQALQKLETTKTDIVLLDVEMPVLNGIDTCRLIREKYPETKIIMLTIHDADEFIYQCMENGCNAYATKSIPIEKMIDMMYGVMQNNFYFRNGINRKLLGQIISKKLIKPVFNNASEFTNREIEIIQLIYSQMSNEEIAQKLFISVRTVERHRENLILKTNSRNSVGVVVYAMTHQLIRL
jgi:DNA-binding NarL/FixJ family response regulator